MRLVRQDKGRKGGWEKLERYVAGHSEADFSHGICNECMTKVREEEGED